MSSEEESHKESLDLNRIQNDDLSEEDLDSSNQINVLTKEQNLIFFEALNAITIPKTRNVMLKSTLEVKSNLLANNKFNPLDSFKRLERTTIKPVAIQNLQHEINNLKLEVKDLEQTQNNHELILEKLKIYENYKDNLSDNNPPIQNTNFLDKQGDEDLLSLINQLKILKFYINIRIVIKNLFLK